MQLQSGSERFTPADLVECSALVATTWAAAADLDWAVPAGPVEWSCLATADHAVDCVFAPAFFLASRRVDAYPEVGGDLRLGAAATPLLLVESLQLATRVLVAVVRDAERDAQAIIFQRPEAITGAPADFLPRAALELLLHAHDVSVGLGVPFEPPVDACRRLREHTRPWPMWSLVWHELAATDDPWGDLLAASGRARR